MRPATPEGRLRVYIVLSARKAGWSEQTLYEGASAVLKRTLKKGFGLSTCTKPELVELADWITAATGGTPGSHGRGTRPKRPAWQGDNTGVVVRLATKAQLDYIARLARPLFGEAQGPGSPFAAFLAGMTHKSEARTLTLDQARKVIEALTSMTQRGWTPTIVNRQSSIDNEAPQ